MMVPHYSSKEIMKQRMLSAFRLCGEIDIDGSNQDYDSEGDNSDAGESDYRYGADENADDGGTIDSVNMSLRYFPVYKRKNKKKSGGGKDKGEGEGEGDSGAD